MKKIETTPQAPKYKNTQMCFLQNLQRAITLEHIRANYNNGH